MDGLLKTFTILGPFLASYLTYLFTTKGKRKDVDLQKEKELNVVLADLMLVWHYLKSFEKITKLLNDDNANSFIPKKYISRIALETNLVNDKCFTSIENSIEMLKKYDPIVYYELQGTGDKLNIIRKKYILPFFQNPNTDPRLIVSGAGSLLSQTTKDIEVYIDNVAKKLGKQTMNEVNSFVKDKSAIDSRKIVQEMNESYFNIVLQLIPEGQTKPSFDEFKEYAKTEDFKKYVEFQMDVLLNHNMDDLIDIVSTNPSISLENLNEELNKLKKKKE
jgi:hypothetical protein